MPNSKKKPAVILAELYDAGVRMRVVDEDRAKLSAWHVEDVLSPEEKVLIRTHKHQFIRLLKFDEELAMKLYKKAVELVMKRIGDDPDRSMRESVWKTVVQWEEWLMEGYEKKDMGVVRWAARKYIETGYRAINEVNMGVGA